MASKKKRKLQQKTEVPAAAEQIPPRPAASPRDPMPILIAAALVLLTLAVYWGVLHNGFINMDDDEYVTENIHIIPGLTAGDISWAFTAVHSSNWHPLTWISHMLDCRIYGLNPMGHHLTSLLFHILNTLLLFLLLSRMTGRMWRSAFVAALFAVHPLHVESVAWVAERKDVLSTMFWLLTMLAYHWYTQKPHAKRYLLVAVLFALGLMSKPMLVSLPLVLILMDYWPLGRAKSYDFATLRRLIIEKLPLFALAAASCAITFVAQSKGGAVGTLERFTLPLRVENALVSYVAYLGKMLFPRGLAVLYPFPSSIPAGLPLGAAAALVAITVVVFRRRTARPYLAAGWLWYLITMVPVIGIVQVGNQAMADRYTYVPLIGVFIAIAWAAPDLLFNRSPGWRRASVVLASIVVLALAIATRVQVGYWRNSITLFEHTIACTSSNYIAHGNLAAALGRADKADQAIREAKITVSLAPRAARPHDKLGAMLAGNGNIREGMEECRKALELDPNLYDAHYNLAAMMDTLGDATGAMREYGEALRLKPDSPESADTHNNMALILGKQGHTDEAIRHFEQALRLNPRLYEAHINYGGLLLKLGRSDQAMEQYEEALRLDPTRADARNGLARARRSATGDTVDDLRKTIQANPQDFQAHYNLGMAYESKGQAEKAAEEYRQAIRLKPDFAPAHDSMGLLLGKQGRLDDALAELRTALRLNPKSADTACNMAVALSMLGRSDEALAALKKAVQIKPEHANAHANLAVLYFQRNDYANAWREVALCRKYGGSPSPTFLKNLAARMPEP